MYMYIYSIPEKSSVAVSKRISMQCAMQAFSPNFVGYCRGPWALYFIHSVYLEITGTFHIFLFCLSQLIFISLHLKLN